MTKNQTEKLWKYISTIKVRLENNNRFFTDRKFLNQLKQIFIDCQDTISTEKYLYRARIYTKDDRHEKHTHPEKYIGNEYVGYGKDESYVNKITNWPTHGRMNPVEITCLYTSTDKETCIKEMYPGHDEYVSIATIKILEDLRIADLSRGAAISDKMYLASLSLYIQILLARGRDEKDYVFPQFVAEYCKSLGYDGIAYRSKYCPDNDVTDEYGKNIAIFNYYKCEVIKSSLHFINNISYDQYDIMDKFK